ncbi:NUDIX hydrolase [Kutzneria kofuensis]|uniref:NUDIX hydrolase n=1 Tax=Kutzneria kofuensis TaxID=103725 RepID=UPI0031ECC52D
MRREVAEETGYTARRCRACSACTPCGGGTPEVRRRRADFHALRIVYEARIVGGELRGRDRRLDDKAAWVPLPEVTALARVDLVDTGLELHRSRPSTGHLGV